MGATPTGATPTGPTLDPLNILVNKFNIATHVALILFLFSSWINYLLYDTKSVMVFWQLLSKIKRFVTIFRISWNGPTLFNIPIGDFPPYTICAHPAKYWFLFRIFWIQFPTKISNTAAWRDGYIWWFYNRGILSLFFFLLVFLGKHWWVLPILDTTWLCTDKLELTMQDCTSRGGHLHTVWVVIGKQGPTDPTL